jgi:hypothetical protein
MKGDIPGRDPPGVRNEAGGMRVMDQPTKQEERK